MEACLQVTGNQDLVRSTRDFLGALRGGGPADVLNIRQSMCYGRESKYITVDIDPKKYKTIELIHLTDLQFGHVCCNYKKIKEYIDWILSVPNRFVLFGGDMVDAATQLSIGSPYENNWEPSEQCLRVVDALLPLRHRVLGYVGGNHERRSAKAFGTLGLFIAALLEIPFSSGQQFIDINYGDWKSFRISLWHGGGAARTKGAKVMMLQRFMQQADSHLYLVGHLHDCFVIPEWRQVRKRGKITLEKYYGAMSSSFLEFWATYAEVVALSPSDTMMVRTIVEPNGHFEVTVR